MVAAMLGILKCSASYTALDPEWPSACILELLQQRSCGVPVVPHSVLSDAMAFEGSRGSVLCADPSPSRGRERFSERASRTAWHTCCSPSARPAGPRAS